MTLTILSVAAAEQGEQERPQLSQDAAGEVARDGKIVVPSGQSQLATGARQQKIGEGLQASQKAFVESLYASEDEAYSRHDIAKILSFADPTYVFVAPDGKRTSYAEWAKNLPASLAQVGHSQVKTTVKTVRDLGNGFVASIEWQHSYDIVDTKRTAWIPMISVATQEETWRRDARGDWTTVLTKTLGEEALERVPLRTLIDRRTQLIAFLCGAPLTAQQKQRIATFAAASVEQNPAAWYGSDITIQKDLKSIETGSPLIRAETWEKWRKVLALSSANDEDARIVEAHDRTVVLDREQQLLVSEKTIQALHDEVSWMNQNFGGPQLDAGYVDRTRNRIKQQFMTWPQERRAAYSEALKNFQGSQDAVYGLLKTPQQRDAFFAEYKNVNPSEAERTNQIVTLMASLDHYRQEVARDEKIVAAAYPPESRDRIRAAIPAAQRILDTRRRYQGEEWWETIVAGDKLSDLQKLAELNLNERSELVKIWNEGRDRIRAAIPAAQMKGFGLPVAAWIILSVAMIGLARRAKPIGMRPYRWGFCLACGSAVGAGNFIAAAIVGVATLGENPGSSSWITLGVVWGAISVAATVGLFRRRRYGAVLYLAPLALVGAIAIAGMVFTLLPALLDHRTADKESWIFFFLSLVFAPYTTINFFYFRNRWGDMGKVRQASTDFPPPWAGPYRYLRRFIYVIGVTVAVLAYVAVELTSTVLFLRPIQQVKQEQHRSFRNWLRSAYLERAIREPQIKEAAPDHQIDAHASEAFTHPISSADELHIVASAKDNEGNYQDAAKIKQEELEQYKKTVGDQQPGYGYILDDLAFLYGKMGRYKEAETLDRQALEILRRPLNTQDRRPSSWPDADLGLHMAKVSDHLALWLSASGRSEEAVPLLLEASQWKRQALTRVLPGLSPSQKRELLPMAEFTEANALISLVLTDPNLAAKAAYEATLSTKYLLPDAERQENAALASIKASATPQWQAEYRELEIKRRLYNALEVECLSLPQHPQSLLDVMRDGITYSYYSNQDRIDVHGPDDDQDYLQLLAGAVNYMRDPHQACDAGGSLHMRELLNYQIEQSEQRLRKNNPTYQALAGLSNVGLEDVSRELRASEALVEYVEYDPYDYKTRQPGNHHYMAFVVRHVRNEVKVSAVELGQSEGIDPAVDTFRKEMTTFIKGGENEKISEDGLGKISSELRGKVWQRLEPALRGATRVYVAPDGQLSLMPFEALAQKISGKWRYLAEEREIVYLDTGRDLARLGSRNRGDRLPLKTAVLVGNPDFNAKPEDLARELKLPAGRAGSPVAVLQEGRSGTLGPDRDGTPERVQIPRNWPEVPSQNLIKELDEKLKAQGYSVKMLTDRDALKEKVEQVHSPGILHIVTHGYFLDHPPAEMSGPDSPLFRSMLIFAGANVWQPVYRIGNEYLTQQDSRVKRMSEEQREKALVDLSDGVLTAYEVRGLELEETELVSLTACDTGLGDVTPEDGVAGLRQAVLSTGARSVTLSMWQVPTHETLKQIEEFYENWLSKGNALSRYGTFRKAQLAALERARQQHHSGHPFYWAGTIFSGDPGDLPIPSSAAEMSKAGSRGSTPGAPSDRPN